MGNTTQRAVSPVVAVILLVAVTVVLSAVIGGFALSIGQSSTSGSQSELGVTTSETGSGTVDVSVITGSADTLRVQVDGETITNITSPSPGDSVSVPVSTSQTVTVVSVTDGSEHVESTTTVSSAPSFQDGLVTHYWLSTGSGTTALDVASTNDGTISGAEWTTTAKTGSYALTFDGSNDSVTAANHPPLTHNLTVAFWISGHGSGDETYVQPHDGGDENKNNIGILSQGSWFGFFAYDTSGGTNVRELVPSDKIRGNGYVHVTITQIGNGTNNPRIKAYLNGELVNNTTFPTGIHQPDTGTLYVGERADGGYDSNATIDDLRIYNRTLSDSEIQQLYSETK